MREREFVSSKKVYSFAEEKERRGILGNVFVKRENIDELPEIFDLSVERTIKGELNDDTALREHWNKRVLDRLILTGINTLPTCDKLVNTFEEGTFDLNFLMKLNTELINGSMGVRLGDGTLVKLIYPVENEGVLIYSAPRIDEED